MKKVFITSGPSFLVQIEELTPSKEITLTKIFASL